MVDSVASDGFVVQSHAGPYRVVFDEHALTNLGRQPRREAHVVIDRKVAELYADDLAGVLAGPSVLRLDATEDSKSLDRFSGYVAHLIEHGVRRGHVLEAVGGGVIQDIVCFLAATLLRGLEWRFYPTTLVAQADSCIGSKSSINVGRIKNALGTFTPPAEVTISATVLSTLEEIDQRSGIGEMIKVHAIEGPASFDRIAEDYPRLLADRDLLRQYIRRSLEIKRAIVEEDEFDRGPRNIMNYGHSFGHAIESATEFAVPHGIAVTLGMDMANYVAVELGFAGGDTFERMHPTLAANYTGFEGQDIPVEPFLSALSKDKKNAGGELRLVLPGRDGTVSLVGTPNDDTFRSACVDYLAHCRRR